MSPPTAPVPDVDPIQAGIDYKNKLWALCAANKHDTIKRYGPWATIFGIVCFPCGLIALCYDVEKRCVRCGAKC